MDTHRRTLLLIASALGAGARNHGCARGPAALREWGLTGRLAQRGIPAHWLTTLEGPIDDDSAPGLVRHFKQLANTVAKPLRQDRPTVILGGDHSGAIGTWSGAVQAAGGPLGMIWIDAHMDAHTVHTSPSGALHGMPLAVLLGIGDSDYVGLPGGQANLVAENTCLIGVRSYEAQERSLLEQLGVSIYYMEQVQQLGMVTVLQQALAKVGRNSTRIGISIDLDAIDPRDAPGVGSPVAHGIAAAELIHALANCRLPRPLAALEIVEYNPELDIDLRTAHCIEQIIAAVYPSEPSP